MHLLPFYTYLSLGFHFHHDDVALVGVGRLLHKLTEENHKSSEHLSKMQNWRSGRALFQDEQEPSQDEEGKTQDAVEAATVLEKNLNQVVWGCMPWLLPTQTPQLCDFLENCFLGEQVKLIKKMGDQQVRSRYPQARLLGYLFQRLPPSMTGGIQSPVVFEEPPLIPPSVRASA